MRYGIMVVGPQLPTADVQRTFLAPRCDVIVEELAMTPEARRRLGRLIARLKRGDELVVSGLGVFGQTTAGLMQTLRDVLSRGAGVVVVGSSEEETRFAPDAGLLAFINAVADHETYQTPASLPRRRGDVGRRVHLTAYQIEYARKLHAEGASARAIGLLFQVTPDDVSQILAP
jgi:hypothetical protein